MSIILESVRSINLKLTNLNVNYVMVRTVIDAQQTRYDTNVCAPYWIYRENVIPSAYAL